jgi:CTP:molybdopterin cytidylyltransferase MocA
LAGAPAAVILAAGAGARFGGNKLLATFRGRPLAEHVAATVSEALAARLLGGGVAVVPDGGVALTRIFEEAGLVARVNPDPAGGLSGSLRVGLAALASPPGQVPPGAAVIFLGDQPLVRLEVVAELVAAWRRTGRSVRPRYADAPGAPGHPVLLARPRWTDTARLTGDAGFRDLLGGRDAILTVIDVAGANPDVNTPADLTSLEDSR